jgi:DNA primase
LLFNYAPVITPVLVLTEGATDAMAAWEVDFDAVACFSNRLSGAQVKLIERMGPDVVVVAFDDDGPGETGAAQAAAMLSRYQVRRAHYGGGKDLAELPPEQRKISIEQAVVLGNFWV